MTMKVQLQTGTHWQQYEKGEIQAVEKKTQAVSWQILILTHILGNVTLRWVTSYHSHKLASPTSFQNIKNIIQW